MKRYITIRDKLFNVDQHTIVQLDIPVHQLTLLQFDIPVYNLHLCNLIYLYINLD